MRLFLLLVSLQPSSSPYRVRLFALVIGSAAAAAVGRQPAVRAVGTLILPFSCLSGTKTRRHVRMQVGRAPGMGRCRPTARVRARPTGWAAHAATRTRPRTRAAEKRKRRRATSRWRAAGCLVHQRLLRPRRFIPDNSCDCNDGYVGSSCYYSDATTCSGHGAVDVEVLSNFSQSLWGHWHASDFDVSAGAWGDTSGAGRDAHVTRGNVSKVGDASGSVYLEGGTEDGITFPEGSIPSTFTIFIVARYTPGAAARQRIFGTSGNWLHGFHGGESGVAYYEGWKTSGSTDYAEGDEWMVVGGRNSGEAMITTNGVNVATSSGGTGGKTLTINHGRYGDTAGQLSSWQVYEVAVWDHALSDAEFAAINANAAALNGAKRRTAVPRCQRLARAPKAWSSNCSMECAGGSTTPCSGPARANSAFGDGTCVRVRLVGGCA